MKKNKKQKIKEIVVVIKTKKGKKK